MKIYPGHWAPITINDTGEYLNGFAFKPMHRENAGRPIIRIKNLTSTGSEFHRTSYLPDDRFLIPKGTILVSWSATLDAFIWSGEEGVLNQHIFKVIPNEKIVVKGFLFILLQRVMSELRKSDKMRGTTMRHINREPFLSYKIAVPMLSEQKRIVKKVEALLQGIEKTEKRIKDLLAQLDSLKATILEDGASGRITASWRKKRGGSEPATSFLARLRELRRFRWEEGKVAEFMRTGKVPTDESWKEKYVLPSIVNEAELAELPLGWSWVTLGSIAEIRGGIAINSNETVVQGSKLVPYLRVANVQRGALDLTEIKEMLVSSDRIRQFRLEDGDILFNEGGDRDKLGRGWVWEGQLEDCVYQNHVFRARPISDELEPKFISMWGNTFGQSFFEKAGKQTTNLASISLTTLSRFPVPLPPHAEQVEILSVIEKLFTSILKQEQQLSISLSATQGLRGRILELALSGELIESTEGEKERDFIISAVASELMKTSTKISNVRKKGKLMPTIKKTITEVLLDNPSGLNPTDLMREASFASSEILRFYNEIDVLFRSEKIEQSNVFGQFEPILRAQTPAAQRLTIKPAASNHED
jgi:type I restriction enzyme S subunit